MRGVEYAVHDAAAGDYVATYGAVPVDPPPTPDTTITDFEVTANTARAGFTSDLAGVRFECRLDGAAYSACTSPEQFTGLVAGQHTVRVRAVHATRGADPTPAERLFAIATPSIGDPAGAGGPAAGGPTPPAGGLLGDPTAHRIRVRPHSSRISRSGGVTLGVTCPATVLSCRVQLRLQLDGRTVATRTLRVTGGTTRSIRLQLSHSARRRLARHSSLRVTATSNARDAAGNQSTARMAVRLLAPRRRYECKLDSAAFAACTSPKAFSDLDQGARTITVKATDTRGNTDNASKPFTVAPASSAGPTPTSTTPDPVPPSSNPTTDVIAPKVQIVSRSVRVSKSGVGMVQVKCPLIEVGCTVSVKLKLAGRTVARKTRTVSGGSTRTLDLRLSRAARSALAARSHVSVNAVVSATDAAGNHRTTNVRMTLRAPSR